ARRFRDERWPGGARPGATVSRTTHDHPARPGPPRPPPPPPDPAAAVVAGRIAAGVPGMGLRVGAGATGRTRLRDRPAALVAAMRRVACRSHCGPAYRLAAQRCR